MKSGDGTKRVYVQFKDNVGDVSSESYDEIILDTDSPSGSITINQDAQYTTSTAVTLQLNYLDNMDISKARYSNDGVWDTEHWETPSETKPWILSDGDGIKTVYAQFRDISGLDSVVVFDTIILDTQPPTGLIVINDEATETASTTVTLTLTAVDTNGVAEMRLSNNNMDWSEWEAFGPKTWNLTSGAGLKTVYTQFKDNAGLISSSYNDTINFVVPQPSPSPSSPPQQTDTPTRLGNIIVYVKDSNNNPIVGAAVASTSQPAGESPLKGITDSSGSVTFYDVVTGSYFFTASKTGFNINQLQATVKSQETTSVTITLQDGSNELGIFLTVTPDGLNTAKRIFTVTIDESIYKNEISSVTLHVDEIAVESWTTAGIHTYEGVYAQGTHTYFVEAIDIAGNTVRNPTSGYLEFSVSEAAPEPTELWKVLAVILIVANGTALIILSLKRKD